MMNKRLPEGLIVGISVLLLLAGLASIFLVSFQFSLADDCENEILKKLVSPDGKYVAVVFERNCGATTGFTTQVSILPIGKSLTNDESGNVFICDGDHGAAPSGPVGGPEVEIKWATHHQVKIAYHQRARVFLQKDAIEGISLLYNE